MHRPEKFPRPAMVLLDYEMRDHTGVDSSKLDSHR